MQSSRPVLNNSAIEQKLNQIIYRINELTTETTKIKQDITELKNIKKPEIKKEKNNIQS